MIRSEWKSTVDHRAGKGCLTTIVLMQFILHADKQYLKKYNFIPDCFNILLSEVLLTV